MWLPGGFTGVDVFFVLSGFLITGQIAAGLAAGRFSLVDFYDRRIRRIIPALAVMLAVTTLVALAILLPSELREFGRTLAASAASLSNFWFFNHTGYFAAPAETQLLLHTWSLSIEEQFYVLFPLSMMALHRYVPQRLNAVIVGVFCVSLAFSAWAAFAKPLAAFYLLPSRAWELMLGSILALRILPPLPSRWQQELATASGAVLVLGSALLLTSQVPFPGIAALPACLGAALIIHAGLNSAAPSTFVARCLSWRPMVFIGLISYSLYLWHWPVIVTARLIVPDGLTWPILLTAAAVTLLLATLSWIAVEQPVRRRKGAWVSSPLVAATAATAVAGFVVVGYASAVDGLPGRFAAEPLRLANFAKDFSPHRKKCHFKGRKVHSISDGCWLGNVAGRPVTVFADSHGTELAAALAENPDFRVRTITTSACSPAGVSNARPLCPAIAAKYLGELSRERPETIVLTANFAASSTNEGFWHGFDNAVATLTQAGHAVVVIGSVPSHTDGVPLPETLARRLALGSDPAAYRYPADASAEDLIDARLRAISTLHRAVYLPVRQELCPDRTRCLGLLDGVPVLSDQHHLSVSGARNLIRRIGLAEVLKDTAPLSRSAASP